jgi:hypothetical protein
LVCILLVPALVLAKEQKVTFSPTDTKLQSNPSVMCETPFYRVNLPKDWHYESQFKDSNTLNIKGTSPLSTEYRQITLSSFSLKGASELLAYGLFYDQFKEDTTMTNKSIYDYSYKGAMSIRYVGVRHIDGRDIIDDTYLIVLNNRVFTLQSLYSPEISLSQKTLQEEIMNTLKLK